MRRGELFWGGLLILLGVLSLMKAAGYLPGDVFGWFWPLVIIVVGLWALLGGLSRRSRYASSQKFSVPVQDAQRATLSIEHGAGEIDLRSGAGPGDFLTGVTGVGMNHTEWRDGDRLLVRLEAGPSFIPVLGPDGGVWEFRLNRDIPIDLSVHSGASRLNLDLTDLLVTSLSFDGGASRLDLRLPARVKSAVFNIQAGAARVRVSVPSTVALRLRSKTMARFAVDEARFPRLEDGLYQSKDFDSAEYCADVTIDGGATSVVIE